MRVLDFSDGFTSASAPTTTATPASDIAVTPSGNLGSTNAQSALVELQGDINTINGKIGTASGIASLDSDGKVPAAQIPLVALVDVNVVADIAARDALTVQEGDVAVVTDAGSGVSKTYIYNGSSWTELVTDGSLYAHLTDSTDAHAASAITNTPSGNVAATTVQGAINELQTDIDTRLSALTGDVTASGGGSQSATIANDAVTNAKAANMAESTIKGRAAGAGTGDPTDLTATQATAILNNVVGDSGSGGTKGLVPAPASGDAAALKFLKADGTWAATPSSSKTVQSKTTTYTAQSSDDVILADTSGGSWTLTLPAGSSGKVFRITKTSNDVNILTIDGDGSENIRDAGTSATTTTINTIGESVELTWNGTLWEVTDRRIPQCHAAYTPSFTGFGTVSSVQIYSRRVGSHLIVEGNFTSGTPTTTEARVSLGFNGTDGNVTTFAFSALRIAGNFTLGASQSSHGGFTLVEPSVSYFTFGPHSTFSNTNSNPVTKQTADTLTANGLVSYILVSVPISGWKS